MANIVEKAKENLTLEKFLQLALKTPGVKINRAKFLRKELSKYYPEESVEKAIKYNPAKAGIPKNGINVIAKSVINYETKKVSALSIAASIPGSINALAAVGSSSADITSYFAHIIRVVQELSYLYGFQEFEIDEDSIDSETLDFLLVFIGVMFGVQGANAALNNMAKVMAANVGKKLAQKALTKGAVYPIIKSIAAKVGMQMTKQIFADTVASAIPIIGSLASGGLTYAMFKPNCLKLQKNLKSYKLSDPDFYDDIVDMDEDESFEEGDFKEVNDTPVEDEEPTDNTTEWERARNR